MKKLFLTAALFAAPAHAATKEVGPIVQNVVAELTDGATISVDGSVAFTFSVTLGGSRTFANVANQVAGSLYTFLIRQDSTGSRVASFGTLYRHASATAPVLTTTAGALDVLLYVSDGTYMNLVSITKDIGAPVGAPTSLTASTNQVEQCTLGWVDNSTDETRFEVELKNEFDEWQHLAYPVANAVSYVDSGIPSGTYVYRVSALRGATRSALSNEATCTAL